MVELFADLIRRIEAAPVGTRDIDADAYQFLGLAVDRRRWTWFHDPVWRQLPHLSSDLTEVTREIERRLPAWSYGSGHGPAGKGSFASHLYRPAEGGPIDIRGFGSTEPLARLSALVRAFAREHST